MVRVRVAHTQTPGPRQAAGEENCAQLEKMWVEFNSSASATATNLFDFATTLPRSSFWLAKISDKKRGFCCTPECHEPHDVSI